MEGDQKKPPQHAVRCQIWEHITNWWSAEYRNHPPPTEHNPTPHTRIYVTYKMVRDGRLVYYLVSSDLKNLYVRILPIISLTTTTGQLACTNIKLWIYCYIAYFNLIDFRNSIFFTVDLIDNDNITTKNPNSFWKYFMLHTSQRPSTFSKFIPYLVCFLENS